MIESLDRQRWLLYRNFYFEESRKLQLQITQFSCPAKYIELSTIDSLPQNESEIQAWAEQMGFASNQISGEEVFQLQSLIVLGCGAELSSTDSSQMASHLESYLINLKDYTL